MALEIKIYDAEGRVRLNVRAGTRGGARSLAIKEKERVELALIPQVAGSVPPLLPVVDPLEDAAQADAAVAQSQDVLPEVVFIRRNNDLVVRGLGNQDIVLKDFFAYSEVASPELLISPQGITVTPAYLAGFLEDRPEALLPELVNNSPLWKNTSFLVEVADSSDALNASQALVSPAVAARPELLAPSQLSAISDYQSSRTTSVDVLGARPLAGVGSEQDLSRFLAQAPAGQTGLGVVAEPQYVFSGGGAVIEGGSLTYTITRLRELSGATVLRWSLSGIEASAGGEDFGAKMSDTLSFAPGQITQRLVISSWDDRAVEALERFVFQLESLTPGEVLDPIRTVSLLDDDFASYSLIGPLSYSSGTELTEGAYLTFTVARAGYAEVDQVLRYRLGVNSAALGEASTQDFVGAEADITFLAGVGGTRTFAVQVSADGLIEKPEDFLLSLSTTSAQATIIAATASGVIVDDDVATFSASSAPATEGLDGFLTFTISRNSLSDFEHTLSYALENGTAQAGNDFSALSGTLTFAAGSANTQTLAIRLVDDALLEPNPEDFVLSLATRSERATLAAATYRASIVDNDFVSYFVSSASFEESHSPNGVLTDGVLTFTVSRNRSLIAGEGYNQTISYSTGSDGSAISDEDYSGTSGTLTFRSDSTALFQTFTVRVINDYDTEGNETFSVSIFSNSAGVTILNATGTGLIIEDDGISQYDVLSAKTYEADVFQTFTVTRTGKEPADIQTVVYSVYSVNSNNSAQEGKDYLVSSGTLTFLGSEMITKDRL